MRALRHGRFWLGIGYLLVAAVATAALIPPPPGDIMASDKLLHLAAYLLLALWFGAIYPRERFAGVGLWLAALGVLLECLQLATGYRSFDWADALANALGVACGLLLAATPAGGSLLWAERRLLGHA
jgi:VanZ family protein